MLKKVLFFVIPLMLIIAQSSISYASDAQIVLKTLLNKGVISKSEFRKIKRNLQDTNRLEQRVANIEAKAENTGTETLNKRIANIEAKTENLGTEELEQRVAAVEEKTKNTGTETLNKRIADIEAKTENLGTEELEQRVAAVEEKTKEIGIPEDLKQRIAEIEKQTGYLAESADNQKQMLAQVDSRIIPTIEEKEESEEPAPAWTDRITLTGAIEGDITYIDKSDFLDKDSESSSNLFISAVEMGIEAGITDWLTGSALFLAEDIGTADETGVAIDEALLTFESEARPIYAVFGKSAKPFGVYENHLISDPMTQAGYETAAPGLTVGITGPMDLDVSVTVCKGDGMMTHLFESGLFETADLAGDAIRAETTDDDISSYILSGSVSPVPEQLTLFASFLSEKGLTERNNTIALGVDYNSNMIEGLLVDVEYIMAMKRDPYTSDLVTGEFKEKVLSASVALVLGGYDRGDPGVTYEERRAHLFAEPVEVAFRFEYFDDDGLEDKTQTWSVKNRYSAGARYSFYEDEELGVAAFAALEYSRTKYRISSALKGTAEDSSNEVMTKLGVSF